jgi:hypothetical protein
MGAGAESYTHTWGNEEDFLIYEEMRKYLSINEDAVGHIYDFAPNPFWISLYMRKNFILFFISVQKKDDYECRLFLRTRL